MELKVWVEGLQRVVCGLTDGTTCQEIIYALAHASNQTGRFVLVEQWRSAERSLAPGDRPLELLRKWGEHAKDVRFVLKCLDETGRVLTTATTSHVDYPDPSGSDFSNIFNLSSGGGLSKPYFVAATGPNPESGTLKCEQHLNNPNVTGGTAHLRSGSEMTQPAKARNLSCDPPKSRPSSILASNSNGGLSVMSTSSHGALMTSQKSDLNRSMCGSEQSFRDSHNASQASLQSLATNDTSTSSGIRGVQRKAVSAGFLSGRSSAPRPPPYQEALKRTKLLSTGNSSTVNGPMLHSVTMERAESHSQSNTRFPPGREELISMIQLQAETKENQVKRLLGIDSQISEWTERDRGLARDLDTMNKGLTRLDRQRQDLLQVLNQLKAGNWEKQMEEAKKLHTETTSAVGNLKIRIDALDTEILEAKTEEENLRKQIEIEQSQDIVSESGLDLDEEKLKSVTAEIAEVESRIQDKQERLRMLAEKVQEPIAESLNLDTGDGAKNPESSSNKETKVPGVWV